MGLLRRISDERERQIVAHATPYLNEDEEILEWARARHPEGKPQGFIYLTDRQVVIHWPGRGDGHGAVELSEVECWGIYGDAKGGPILGMETSDAAHFVQLRVATTGMAHNLTRFLQRFAELAPRPRRSLSEVPKGKGTRDDFRPHVLQAVDREKRSIAQQTKRILVTVVGVLLVIGGIAITPLPGPWSFPIILGGLAVLANEFDWAQDTLDWVKDKYQKAKSKLGKRRSTNEE